MTDVDRDFCKIFIRADSGPTTALLQHALDGRFQDKLMTLPRRRGRSPAQP
ncbi:hypothetical protein [Microlunatus sp. GCM10028923]|uniref:hypothetical protein n=1 Tax=Microlunatus sp. GCM10028923 TaxID=3273400 RepID=UPI003610C43B